jgi:hypothetical protein
MDIDRLRAYVVVKRRERLRMDNGINARLIDLAGARSFLNLN